MKEHKVELFTKEYKDLYSTIMEYIGEKEPDFVDDFIIVWEEPMIYFDWRYYKKLSITELGVLLKVVMLSSDDGFISFGVIPNEKPMVINTFRNGGL